MTQKEQIVLLDKSGKPIGSAPKLDSHHAKTPLHLAFSTYVFNAQGEVLLTRRADTKKVFPGIWTNSCCGHPGPEEPITQAIARRLKQELGITPHSIRLALPHYRYRAAMNGIVENEICPVYIVTTHDEPKPNPDEVAEYRWVSWQEFRRLSKSKKFSPWAREQSRLLDPIINVYMVTRPDIDSLAIYRKPLLQDIRRLIKGRGSGDTNHWRMDVQSRLDKYAVNGKLLRGCLLQFSHDAFGGTNKKAAKTAAACLELLHAALLIHDDVMDGDAMRRGNPAMHRQYEDLSSLKPPASKHFGESMAICVADAAIFKALGSLGSITATTEHKTKIIDLFSRVLETVCYGQMLDIELGQSEQVPDESVIMMVMEQKTAVYSLSLPLVTGAILANQPTSVIGQLEKLGKIIGTIFQIRDDELGIFGDPSTTGKPVGSDIKEGKKTLLYHYLFHNCTAIQKKRLKHIFGNQKASDADIKYVRSLMIELGLPERIDEKIADLTIDAVRIISKLDINKRNQRSLYQLVAFCAIRDV